MCSTNFTICQVFNSTKFYLFPIIGGYNFLLSLYKNKILLGVGFENEIPNF